MANIFGVDIETPQEAQQRILREIQASGRNLKNTNQQFGFNLATALSQTFGGMAKAREGRENQQSALAEGQNKRQEILNDGGNEFDAEMAGRAHAAALIRKLPGDENEALANQLRDDMTKLRLQKEAEAREIEKHKASVTADTARTKAANRQEIEAIDQVDEIDARLEITDDPLTIRMLEGRRKEIARETELVDEKRKFTERELEQRDRRLTLDEGRETRIANALNTKEIGIINNHEKQWKAGDDQERAAIDAKAILDRSVDAGRTSGKALDVHEAVKEFTGMQDEDITVAQKTLSERAMKRAFSLKQSGAMSDEEFRAYMTAVNNASASAESWNEFLRLDAIAGARLATYSSYQADYISGIDMGEGYSAVEGYKAIPQKDKETQGVPRGVEGAGAAWRVNKDVLMEEINEKYSPENWGNITSTITGSTEQAAEESDEEARQRIRDTYLNNPDRQ
jgi:hypothetical protein